MERGPVTLKRREGTDVMPAEGGVGENTFPRWKAEPDVVSGLLSRAFDRGTDWETVSQRIALHEGFHYLPAALPRDDPVGIFQLPLSLTSGNCLAEDVLAGTWKGIPFLQFQITYWAMYQTVSSGTREGRASWSCAATQVEASFPRVAIRQMRPLERLPHLFRWTRVPQEQRRFWWNVRVDSEDAGFAAELLHPALQNWLLGSEAWTLSFEMEGCWVMSYAREMPPTLRSKLVWALTRLVQHVPTSLLEGHRARPDPSLRDRIAGLGNAAG
jgi:hypothetical protein